ncbi:MAG: peptidoglycan DD-metalloendopeptidase family protein [Chloroflexi bacterium]|nr:peptidoglycan DD-metalloendopeptidase family protein [Chloroflexota bacterium]
MSLHTQSKPKPLGFTPGKRTVRRQSSTFRSKNQAFGIDKGGDFIDASENLGTAVELTRWARTTRRWIAGRWSAHRNSPTPLGRVMVLFLPQLPRLSTHFFILIMMATLVMAGQRWAPNSAAQPFWFFVQHNDYLLTGSGTDAASSSIQGFLYGTIIPHTLPSLVANRGSSGISSAEIVNAGNVESDINNTPVTSQDTDPLIIPVKTQPRQEISTYHVQQGDTVLDIAGKFGIDSDTLISANADLQSNPNKLSIGQELTILPVAGAVYKIGSGDTLISIAQKFKVKVEDIVNFQPNNLKTGDTLAIGQQIVVPGGKLPEVAKPKTQPAVSRSGLGSIVGTPASATKGTGGFIWPTRGYITTYFSAAHVGIDIAFPLGTPIYAADSGYVTFAGWSGGYGNLLKIDHGNGVETWYAHMNGFLVNVGQNVERGTQVGSIGLTGRTTGPHLHFEIHVNGVEQNPMGYLP